MSLAKGLLVLLVVVALFGATKIFDRKDNVRPANPATAGIDSATTDRGDDPTYAEEVKQLTAIVSKLEEENERKDAEFLEQINDLNNQLEDANRANKLNRNDQSVEKLRNDFNALKNTLPGLIDPLKANIASIASTQAQLTQAPPVKRDPNVLSGYTRITPINLSTPSSPLTLGQNPSPIVETGTGSSDAEQRIPVFTLHNGAILAGSRSATPIIGRVPNGASNVNDPFRFRLITGADNIVANGLRVPGIKNAIWSGFALGIREERCVRGYLDTVTFVFEDGTIATFPETDRGARTPNRNTAVNQALGYLSDEFGRQCLQGVLVNNASQYLKSRGLAAFAEGMAAAYASAETSVERTNNGLEAFVSGDTIRFGLGRGASRTATEYADYIRERQANAFDVVYFPSNQTVQIMVEQQIEIDYDLNGRKVSYDYASTE